MSPGFTAVGQDGGMYKVVVRANGRHAWEKEKPVKEISMFEVGFGFGIPQKLEPKARERKERKEKKEKKESKTKSFGFGVAPITSSFGTPPITSSFGSFAAVPNNQQSFAFQNSFPVQNQSQTSFPLIAVNTSFPIQNTFTPTTTFTLQKTKTFPSKTSFPAFDKIDEDVEMRF